VSASAHARVCPLVCYRAPGYHPPLRTEPSREAGRFHRADEPAPTQYLCLHPLGPAAERIRRASLPDVAIAELATDAWALRIDPAALVRIGFDDARAHGLEPDELVADDHGPCQRLASRLRARGVPGLRVPSAALPGAENVVLFGERVLAGYLDGIVDPMLDVPGAPSAVPAGAPAGLARLVRRPGQPHAALEAWRRREPFRIAESAVWRVAAQGGQT
jgi:hypothetical protein